MASDERCPRCGTALPAGGAAGGGCRRCLLALGLGSRGSSADGETERIGPFRILDTLVRGDGSVTCRAEDDAGRRVALRLLEPREDSDAVQARLEAERDRLNRVRHPAVVTHMDVGRAEDGRLWLATDWMAGVPITELCDRERLTVRQRLEVMVEVCDAVDAAHAAGLVHLDLRPSRVLMTMEEDRPHPRVLDFGVAGALDSRPTEAALYSTAGVSGGALGYAGPERLEPTPDEPDLRSDVYALGALTYVLLVGVLPFEPRRLRRAQWDEIRRIIREEDPPPPSARIASLPADVSLATAARRQTDPATWGRGLRGDLDWIVMKSLEKDPSARYPSAGALSHDLSRHLRGEPVAPGLSTLRERLRQMLRRVERLSSRRTGNRKGGR